MKEKCWRKYWTFTPTTVHHIQKNCNHIRNVKIILKCIVFWNLIIESNRTIGHEIEDREEVQDSCKCPGCSNNPFSWRVRKQPSQRLSRCCCCRKWNCDSHAAMGRQKSGKNRWPKEGKTPPRRVGSACRPHLRMVITYNMLEMKGTSYTEQG